VEWLGLTLTPHHTPLSQLLLSDPLAPLDHAGDDGPPSPELVLLLLLLLLVTSPGAKPYSLVHVPRRCSPCSSTAHQLGPTIESHDPGARPLPDGATWWASQQSNRLPHRLLRSSGVLEPKGTVSFEGSASGGPDAAREGVGKVGSVVAACANAPRGRPRGPMEMCAIRRITGAPTGSVTTEMLCSSYSSSPPSSSP
jgi:hypothetical protein